MLELTQITRDTPFETKKTLVMREQVTHVEDAGHGMARVYFANGSSIKVAESLETVRNMIGGSAKGTLHVVGLEPDRIRQIIAEQFEEHRKTQSDDVPLPPKPPRKLSTSSFKK